MPQEQHPSGACILFLNAVLREAEHRDASKVTPACRANY